MRDPAEPSQLLTYTLGTSTSTGYEDELIRVLRSMISRSILYMFCSFARCHNRYQSAFVFVSCQDTHQVQARRNIVGT